MTVFTWDGSSDLWTWEFRYRSGAMSILSKVFKRKKTASKRVSGGIKHTDIHGKKKTISREEVDKHKSLPRVIVVHEKSGTTHKPKKATRRKVGKTGKWIWKHLV